MRIWFLIASVSVAVLWSSTISAANGGEGNGIPLPEHPRPDFQRADWMNLNGPWDFQFDPDDRGIERRWFDADEAFPLSITVPFPWGSRLSGVPDEADVGWYRRAIRVPESWAGERVFLVVGASDWHTTVWLDGHLVGRHQGGYTPFSIDLTPQVRHGQEQRLVVRVDDTPYPFKLEGKQGYGRAAGIWQTVYLERRPAVALEAVHFLPDIDRGQVTVDVTLNQAALTDLLLHIHFQPHDRDPSPVTATIAQGADRLRFDVPLENVRLWSLEDPYLYEVTASLQGEATRDEVATYFGMRKISVGTLPGTDYPYVYLNNRPVYLQMTLDQAYHPDGYYTFPSDEFMRDEILRTRQIGLNGQRIHIKVEVPRKLYWADRLGVLIMADVPNSWGAPSDEMKQETEFALRGMIRRDFNHPSIFSWVDFNETWGLRTGDQGYLPETQEWVESIYYLTKQLDPTRLVEDNSPCHYDHVATDLNTWHAYLPGYAWRERLEQICRDTYPGSTWNFIGGRQQGSQPMFNSECGNVWGYEGSTGDVDWSWDYHLMLNEFRRHPKVCGWLYTEHHDVINEWNGYWRYDRSNKHPGLSELAPGMTLRDLHSDVYIAVDRELCRDARPGETLEVPLFASFMTDADVGPTLTLDMQLHGWDTLGAAKIYWRDSRSVDFQPWLQAELEPLRLTLPHEPALVVLTVELKDRAGAVLHRNFATYRVTAGPAPRDAQFSWRDQVVRVVRFGPETYQDAQWSLKHWQVLDGLKVNGAGSGYFEYVLPWPAGLAPDQIGQASLRMELSAKQLYGKDRDDTVERTGDFMRGEGTHDPSSNPNAYPMTDDYPFPSAVRVRVAGHVAGQFDLPDDPADQRGILSWHSQLRDRRLREAGSYGYLVDAVIPRAALEQAHAQQRIVVRLEVDAALPHGVAVYGERFGRYPLDPSLVFVLKE